MEPSEELTEITETLDSGVSRVNVDGTTTEVDLGFLERRERKKAEEEGVLVRPRSMRIRLDSF